jgi:ABC-type dipeptide/oligopeptide/nickel transport system ATPase component
MTRDEDVQTLERQALYVEECIPSLLIDTYSPEVVQARPILSVRNLSIGFDDVELVRNVQFDLYPKKTLALVGESGSGKTLTAQALMQLFASPKISVRTGEFFYEGKKLLPKELVQLRGSTIAYVSQNPLSALNPTMSIGKQLAEALLFRKTHTKAEAKEEVLRMLRLVGISDGMERYDAYPHTLSGGMRQRILIALALISKPKILIADEATTALDVTIQAQILDLLQHIQQTFNLAILFITHDLGVVARIGDEVAVMSKGTIVESGTANDIFYRPQHHYTKTLLEAVPR